MAALGIESERNGSVDRTERKSAFVAIPGWIALTANRLHFDVVEPSEMLECVLNDPALDAKLFIVIHVHQRTASAAVIRFAERLHAMR